MSPTSGQANDTPLNGQRPNYGSLTHLNQPAAVRTRVGPNPNAPSPASSLKSRQRQQDGTGTGTVAGVGAGTAVAGARNTATSHRSVQITVPGQDEHGNTHANNDQDGDDTGSTSSRSSYSTYSSSTGSLHALDHHNRKGHSHGEGCEPGEEEEEASSRRMFWTYVGLTPILLSILVLFAVLLQFLPSSAESGENIVHWDRFGEGAIGWIIAFAARTPLFALFSKTLSHSHNPQEDFYLCEWSTLLSAGALEETLRLAIILFLGIGEDFGAVYWLGLGWAGVETVYYIGQSLVYTRWLASPTSDEDYRTVAAGIGNGVAATTSMVVAPTVSTSLLASVNASAGGPSTSTSTSETPSSLESGYTNGKSRVANHTDIEEAEDLVPTREARHLLGLDRPWWSLMGRTSSMMVHIGLCCWLGRSGWRLLLPAAAVHGSLYVIWGVFMPDGWSVPATSYGTWIAALGVFLIGLALYGEIV
ncbi:hypothetical protein EC957_004474 [Mortierella hygrophila]|uniref:Uncharacterized protein n=1 Tax=Mortierella hygrophila TaxID=979708 RepID=A0A9P6K0C2_9FUNG|nr:hypothetical protein EC957_004474 [Mortierella hygrophila]